VSKLVAGREKDREFVSEMRRHGMIDDQLLLDRLGQLPISETEKDAAVGRWKRIVLSA
jgi:hypothetical protein